MDNLFYLEKYNNYKTEFYADPDREEADKFLRLLDSKSRRFTFQIFDDNKDRKDPKLTRIIHGSLDEYWDELVELNRKGAGIFVTVNETDGKGRREENIIAVRAIFQDDDEGFQGAYPLLPSIEVTSSPGKFQRYWLCPGATKGQFKAVQRCLVENYGCDKSVTDLPRVMRLPGFWHQKDPAHPHLVTLLKASPGKVYTAEEVVKAFLGEVDSASSTPAPLSQARQADISVYSATPERVQMALSYIPAHDREIWLKVGMALNQQFGEAGRELWDEWSLSAPSKYNEADQDKTWKSFKAKPGRVEIGTVFYLAKKNGLPQDALTTDMEEKYSMRQNGGDESSIDWPECSPKTRSITADSIPNVRAFLKSLGLHLWLDLFEGRIRIDGWEEHAYLDDHVLSLVWGQANELGFRPSKNFMKNAFVAIAASETRHPLRDFLNGLQWDGIPRAEKLLIDYANAEDNCLNRAIGKLLLIAMVRRVFQPGCKFDYMVILRGEQGCGKSLFCKELAGGPQFFEENLTLSASAKEIMEQTAGKWVVEIGELSGLSAKDIQHQKSFITRTEDRARLSYGYFASSVPRKFVLIGTTNEEVFLRDATGNRRYLPVRVSNIDFEALRRDREQLLAEAIALEKSYGPLVMPQDLSADLIRRQKAAANIDDSYERLSDYIEDKLLMNPCHEFPKDDLYKVIGVSIEFGNRPLASHGKVIAKVTRDFGLTESKKGFDPDGKRPRVFIREKSAGNLGQKNTSLS